MQSKEIVQHQNQAERLKWNSFDSWDVKLTWFCSWIEVRQT